MYNGPSSFSSSASFTARHRRSSHLIVTIYCSLNAWVHWFNAWGVFEHEPPPAPERFQGGLKPAPSGTNWMRGGEGNEPRNWCRRGESNPHDLTVTGF